jgi:hypothetical protein
LRADELERDSGGVKAGIIWRSKINFMALGDVPESKVDMLSILSQNNTGERK